MPAPTLATLKVLPLAFRAASTGGSIARKRKTGTTITYTDSQAARTTFTVLKPQPAVMDKHRRCVKATRRRRGKRCTRYVTIGSFTHTDVAGRNSFHFTGRLGARKLKPGRYKLQAVPRANGITGGAATIPFGIIR
jgi:hypothetical protein